jgi:hypothetical protein
MSSAVTGPVADSFFYFLEKRSLPPTAAEGLRVGQRIGVQRLRYARRREMREPRTQEL